MSQAAEYSCDHKPLTYEESSTRGCVAPSPLYTRRNIANTSELSAGALPRRVLERNMSSNTTNSANGILDICRSGKQNPMTHRPRNGHVHAMSSCINHGKSTMPLVHKRRGIRSRKQQAWFDSRCKHALAQKEGIYNNPHSTTNTEIDR